MPLSDPGAVRVKFYGARGSVPTPGHGTIIYGGNTACVEITWGESGRLILDAGTGIRLLGEQLAMGGNPPKRIDIAFSHLHWDHIQGLPFFIPMYISGTEIHLWGGSGKGVTLDLMMDHQLHSAFFPIGRASLAADIFYHLLGTDETELPEGKLTPCAVNHPGGCYSFRFEILGRSIIYATDYEKQFEMEGLNGNINQALEDLAQECDLLIHDAQYSNEEYNNFRRGWGHSTFDDSAVMARKTGAKRLALFHHDPSHDDVFLAAQEQRLRSDFPDIQKIIVASEGLEIIL